MSVHESINEADVSHRHTWEQAVAMLLADPDGPKLAHDSYLDGSALQAAERYQRSEEWQAARLLLPAGTGRALDVGAGRGITSFALACAGWHVHAVEPDVSDLVGTGAIRSLVKASGQPIEVVQAFGERLPFPDEQFELVVARQALHHARDLQALLRELYRVLRPGGRLIALREHVISRISDLQRFQAIHPLHRFYGGEHAYLLRQYTAAMRAAGLRVRQVIAPLESPINYAPLTLAGLAEVIATRVPGLPCARWAATRLLRSASVLAMTLRLLRYIDDRPGRLYSFVADRPAR